MFALCAYSRTRRRHCVLEPLAVHLTSHRIDQPNCGGYLFGGGSKQVFPGFARQMAPLGPYKREARQRQSEREIELSAENGSR